LYSLKSAKKSCYESDNNDLMTRTLFLLLL